MLVKEVFFYAKKSCFRFSLNLKKFIRRALIVLTIFGCEMA